MDTNRHHPAYGWFILLYAVRDVLFLLGFLLVLENAESGCCGNGTSVRCGFLCRYSDSAIIWRAPRHCIGGTMVEPETSCCGC